MLHPYKTRFTSRMSQARVDLERIDPEKFRLYPNFAGEDHSDSDSLDGSTAVSLTQLLKEHSVLTPPYIPFWMVTSPPPVPATREELTTLNLADIGYTSSASMTDINLSADNWNIHTEETPDAYQDEDNMELQALMDVDTDPTPLTLPVRATTAELLGDSPLPKGSVTYEYYDSPSQSPYFMCYYSNNLRTPSPLPDPMRSTPWAHRVLSSPLPRLRPPTPLSHLAPPSPLQTLAGSRPSSPAVQYPQQTPVSDRPISPGVPHPQLTLVDYRSRSPIIPYDRINSPDYGPRPATPVDYTDLWPCSVSRSQHFKLPPKKAYLRCTSPLLKVF